MALHESIQTVKKAAGMSSKDLAEATGLSPSAISMILSGKRDVKAAEAVAIAKALGVSPLALLEPDSLVGRVSIAARTTETTRATASPLLRRLQRLAELATLIPNELDHKFSTRPDWSHRPKVDSNWLSSARALATWAIGRMDLPEPRFEVDQFAAWTLAIQADLGIDVVVEGFDDPVIGGAVVGEELPIIAINSRSQGRQRALFTLAHELGHVLAAHGSDLRVDVDVSPRSDQERFANAFAAELLLPVDRVRTVVANSDDIRQAVSHLMIKTGVSKQTAIYRLHNLRMINADQRDYLIELHTADLGDVLTDDDLRVLLFAVTDTLPDRMVRPVHLMERLLAGYREGYIAAAPVADLLGRSIEDVIDEFGSDEVPQQADTKLAAASLTATEAAFELEPM